MKILLIKTSSMGDVIHMLPALTDAGKYYPHIQFDWVIEKPFISIPKWHPLVKRVIPVSLRDWRRKPFSKATYQAWKAFGQDLKNKPYDKIIDAQGLIKSALLTTKAKGLRVGLDFKSAREGIASWFYQQKVTVNFYQHAVKRMRLLLSQALDYPLPESPPDFAINLPAFDQALSSEPYVVFLHGTTWRSKEWPESYWILLAKKMIAAGLKIKLSGGSDMEMARAERIASTHPHIELLPWLNISEMAQVLSKAKGAVAVDTGFGHLAAALAIPTVSLYGATDSAYTGTLGQSAKSLQMPFNCSPCLKRVCQYRGVSLVSPACYESLTPEIVWQTLNAMMSSS